ncbi:TetR/AcrR family transcriptional regulator [Aeromicrobium sp. 179-A 4D2 NHS]|uniref:TetR/AcrR family transcriptional regulator n=1 Tax=Aeromicrobium sp. 179-A 4D2 NHS TaxID=3142375 RepID=UPI00399FA320
MSRPRSRRQQYSDETREALLTAAKAQFLERGYARTALADVAADAQVTRGAVYHHFKDKQDLFAAVLDRTETEGMDAVRDAYLAHEDTVTGAFAAISAYLDHGLDPEYAEIVLRQGPIALGWEQWTQTQSRYAAGLIEQIITSLVSSGRIVSLPIETTSAITFNALAGCATAIAGTDPADRERVRRECGEVMVHLLSGLLV